MKRFSEFLRDRAGNAAIEFALIAALFLAPLFLGVTEISFLLQADRRAAHLAAVVGDLAASGGIEDKTDLDKVMALVLPGESASLQMSISCEADDMDDCPSGYPIDSGTCMGEADTMALLATSAVEIVIITRVCYNYSPPIMSMFTTGNITLDETHYAAVAPAPAPDDMTMMPDDMSGGGGGGGG